MEFTMVLSICDLFSRFCFLWMYTYVHMYVCMLWMPKCLTKPANIYVEVLTINSIAL